MQSLTFLIALRSLDYLLNYLNINMYEQAVKVIKAESSRPFVFLVDLVSFVSLVRYG